jgi:hypothetical protein
MSSGYLAISNTDFKNSGCVACGCEYCYGTGISGGGSFPAICGECKSRFVILADGMTQSSIGFGDIYPTLSVHPRLGIPKHAFVTPDIRPDNGIGEFWRSRGVGYGRFGDDCSGFIKSKQAGERIVAMFKEVVGEDAKTYLDYRPNEPTWIQLKVQGVDVDLKELNRLTADDGIITIDRVKKAYEMKISGGCE